MMRGVSDPVAGEELERAARGAGASPVRTVEAAASAGAAAVHRTSR